MGASLLVGVTQKIINIITTRVIFASILNVGALLGFSVYLVSAFQGSLDTLERSIGRELISLTEQLQEARALEFELLSKINNQAALISEQTTAFNSLSDQMRYYVSEIGRVSSQNSELLKRSLPRDSIELGLLDTNESVFIEVPEFGRQSLSFEISHLSKLEIAPEAPTDGKKYFLYVSLFSREGGTPTFVSSRTVVNEVYPFSRSNLVFGPIESGDYFLVFESPRGYQFRINTAYVDRKGFQKEKNSLHERYMAGLSQDAFRVHCAFRENSSVLIPAPAIHALPNIG